MWWIGCYETVRPPVLPWFFHRNYAVDMAEGVRYIFRARRCSQSTTSFEPSDPGRFHCELQSLTSSTPTTDGIPEGPTYLSSIHNSITSRRTALPGSDSQMDLADCITITATEDLEWITELPDSDSAVTSIDQQNVELTSTRNTFSSAIPHNEGGTLRRRTGEWIRVRSIAALS